LGRKVTGLIPLFEDMAAGLLNDYEKNPLPFRERIFIWEGDYIMQITGSYNNYLTMTNLLAPLGVRGSGSLVMQVFTSVLGNLQNKINQQIFSEKSETALKELYNGVSDLAGKAKNLTLTDFSSVFNDRTAIASDTNVLTATAIDAFSPESGATEATYNISVAQIAQTQENTGLELNAADSSVADLGTNTFNINISGQDQELSIDVVEGDTNEDVLQKMAQAINNANIGVSAEATVGAQEGTKTIAVISDNTGAASAFTISDVSGNAVVATGADSVSIAAQNATFEVDGINYTSDSNTIYLDEGLVMVNLQGAGESTLTVTPDEEKVKNAVTGLVSEVNSFIDLLQKNSDYINDEVLSSVNSYINDHQGELESFGITRAEDGTLEVDTDKLTTAMNQNMAEIKEAFGGFDGLAVQLNNYASRIVTDTPLNYAKEAENMSIEFADYLYGTSAGMLQNLTQGTLLNSYL
jgi:flagellar hook-associated protein 2